MKPTLWSQGEKSRPLQAVKHEGFHFAGGRYVGFLTGSDENGHGFTRYICEADEFERVAAWVAALTPENARVFVKTIIRRPDFAFAGSGL